MSFYLKYELSRLLSSDGAKTFQAIEKSTRRDVLLHLVEKSASPPLVAKVKQLQTGSDGDLLEVGEFAGSYFVVTKPIEDFQGLGPWLDSRASDLQTQPVVRAPVAAAPAHRPPPASPPSQPPGEFTQMFGEKLGTGAAPPPPPKQPTSPTILDVGVSPPPRPPAPPPPPAEPPGEFTRLFGESQKPSRRPQAPASPQPPPAPPSVPQAAPPSPGGGEFTRLFGEAAPARPQPVAPKPPPAVSPPPAPRPAAAPPQPPPAAAKGGEFTQLFGESRSTPAPSAEPAPLTPSAPAAPGGFTDIFGPDKRETPVRPVTPAPAAAAGGTPVEKSSGEFTRLFGGGGGSSPDAVPRLKPVAPASGDVAKSSGEFTRLFGPSGKGGSPAKATTTPTPAPVLRPSPLEGSLGSSAGAPGEFTRMFGGGAKGGSAAYGASKPLAPRSPAPPSFGEGLVGEISGDDALAPEQAPRASKSSKPFQAAGEFTRMFGPSDPSQRPAEDFIPAAQRGGSDGYASGLFRNPHAEQRARPAAGATPAEGQKPAAPGDYTLMFERDAAGGGAPAAPAAQAQPPPGAIAAAPAAPPRPKGMIIALVAAVVIAFVALGAAVYLFLNRSSDDPADKPAAVEQPADPAQTKD